VVVALFTLSLAAAQPAATRAPSRRLSAVPPAIAAIPQADTRRESSCWVMPAEGSSFAGTMSIADEGGRKVIRERVGRSGSDRVIQKRFGDLDLCMLAEDAGGGRSPDQPTEWMGRARRLVLEAR